MAKKIVRSKKKLGQDQIEAFKAQALRIDQAEAESIKSRGRAAFRHHEHLQAILHQLVCERKRVGVSLAELEQRTGIAKSNLSRLENSPQATPSLETLERYAAALGKTVRVELTDAA